MVDITDIFYKNYKLLFRIVYALTYNIEDTKDILQETYLKAYKAVNEEILPNKLLPWMIVIAKNTTKDFLKKHIIMEQIDELSEQNSYEPDFLKFTIYNALKDIIYTVPEDLRNPLKQNVIDGIPLKRLAREKKIPFSRLRYWHDKLIKDVGSIIGQE